MPSMAALSFCSCSPMLWSFCGFGVRSLASVLRALRRPFLPERITRQELIQQTEELLARSPFTSVHVAGCVTMVMCCAHRLDGSGSSQGQRWTQGGSHLLCDTVCWGGCWSSMTETSAHPPPVSSLQPFLEHTCTPRNSDASAGARLSPLPAPPPHLIGKDKPSQNRSQMDQSSSVGI